MKLKEIEYKGFRLFEVIHNGNEKFIVAEPLDINSLITKINQTVIAGENFEDVKRKIDNNFRKSK